MQHFYTHTNKQQQINTMNIKNKIKQFINTLEDNGFKLTSAFDAEQDEIKNPSVEDAYIWVSCCESGIIRFTYDNRYRFHVYFTPYNGDDLGDCIPDYSWSRGTPQDVTDAFEKIFDSSTY